MPLANRGGWRECLYSHIVLYNTLLSFTRILLHRVIRTFPVWNPMRAFQLDQMSVSAVIHSYISVASGCKNVPSLGRHFNCIRCQCMFEARLLASYRSLRSTEYRSTTIWKLCTSDLNTIDVFKGADTVVRT